MDIGEKFNMTLGDMWENN